MSYHKKMGVLYVALSGFFFGFIGYFGISIMHAHISVNTMLFWRFLVSGLFMFAIILFQPQLWRTPPQDMLKAFLYGFIFYGPSSMLFFMAADYIGTGLAMVIFYTFPAMVLFFNFIVYKHPIGKLYIFAIVLMLIGMFCLTQGQSTQINFEGIALSLISALLFALYMIVSKNSVSPAQMDTLMVCAGSMLSSWLIAYWSHSFFMPHESIIWFNIAGIGILCTAVPILLLLKGLKNIGALQASILSVLEPVFVLILGVTLLGEAINLTQTIGISILLFGALLSLLSE